MNAHGVLNLFLNLITLHLLHWMEIYLPVIKDSARKQQKLWGHYCYWLI